jgi:hypothetical protein
MDVCENGHALMEHFGSLWHTQTLRPICPQCGAGKDGYRTVKGRYHRKGWFGREFVEESTNG